MNTMKRTIAATELILIFPAALFMTALFVRELQPQQFEPAHTAQRIVMWYSARPHVGLWIMLMALPITVLVIGCVTLLRSWNEDAALRQAARQVLGDIRAHFATFCVAAATLTAGARPAHVSLHVATD